MNWIESLFKIACEVFRMIGEAINENKIILRFYCRWMRT